MNRPSSDMFTKQIGIQSRIFHPITHTHKLAPTYTQTHINIHLDSSNVVRLPWKDYISSENKEEKPHHASALFAMSKAKANTFYLEIINSY